LPLSEKVRIETYLPDVNRPAFSELLATLEQEFTYAFGGCSVIRGVDGNFLSRTGVIIHDRINILFSDMSGSIAGDFKMISEYADAVREAALHALGEEAILVVVYSVYHSE